MCGIAYKHNLNGNPVNNDILQQFDLQRHRGTEGFGLFDGQEMNMVHAAQEDRILRWLVRYDSNLILFHHRNPTSTINVKRAAHPFTTQEKFGDNQYVLVHNGHINNSSILFEQHQKQGIKYQSKLKDGTFNDSESLLWDFANVMEGNKTELTARGGIAFICLKIVKGKLDKMFFARNTSPLNLVKTEDSVSLSSEGVGTAIKPSTLYTYDYSTNELTDKLFSVPQHETYSYDGSRLPATNQAGNWLPMYLRDKYKKEINEAWNRNNITDYDREGNPIPYDEDDYIINEAGIYVPNYPFDDYELSEEEIEELELSLPPTRAEIENRVMEYLYKCNGLLETSYWLAENDYELAQDLPMTPNNQFELMLIEGAMDYIENEEEIVDAHSTSKLWRDIWKI
jgi:predicted glutamine amidotransferase